MPSTLAAVPDIDDALAQSVSDGLIEVEQRLRESVASSDDMMQWTGRYLLDAGGKRVRPMLVLLAASLGDAGRDEVIDSAVLVELTHLASLYHDDVMDSAATRRGAPAAHQVWSNSVAILTGDFLFARASALSASLGPQAVLWHAETFERLCLGQLHETVGVAEGQDPFDHYLSVLSDKTASLISVAGRLGATLGEAPAGAADILYRYGEKVGVAFQLADDVLDLSGSARTSGKTPGTDLREGIPTMPTLLVRKRHAESPDDQSRAIVERLDGDLSSDASLAELVALLREDPSLEETRRLAQEMSDDAGSILDELPASPVRDALHAFTVSMVDRVV